MAAIDDVLARLRRLYPKEIDLSLGRVERLLARLGHPERRLPPVVHIAGTNGKGSVTAMLRAMLEAADRRTHAYTTPHLVRFAERIVLAGTGSGARAAPIGEDRLVAMLERVEAVNSGEPITLFEITTAAALVAFAEAPADVLLLEVGVGGRLDATNVISQPRLVILTPIAIDHAELLGSTIASIAAEKAAILKPGVPVIVSRQDEEAMPAIERAAARNRSRLTVWGRDFDAYEQRGRLVFQSAERLLDLPRPALVGVHQIVNAGTAVAAALALGEAGLDERAIERGLLTVEWPARMQRLSSGPLTSGLNHGSELWLDGGHNPAGAMVLAETLAALEERSAKPLVLIVAMMARKDARGFLAPFLGLAGAVRTVAVPMLRGASDAPHAPDALADMARGMGFAAAPAASVPAALSEIEADGAPKRIVICGSLNLAGHVLALQTGAEQQAN